MFAEVGECRVAVCPRQFYVVGGQGAYLLDNNSMSSSEFVMRVRDGRGWRQELLLLQVFCNLLFAEFGRGVSALV